MIIKGAEDDHPHIGQSVFLIRLSVVLSQAPASSALQQSSLDLPVLPGMIVLRVLHENRRGELKLAPPVPYHHNNSAAVVPSCTRVSIVVRKKEMIPSLVVLDVLPRDLTNKRQLSLQINAECLDELSAVVPARA